jgi:hypothetical protein
MLTFRATPHMTAGRLVFCPGFIFYILVAG